MKTNQIICGDCAEVLANLSDNSIDMIFVDPPYGKDGLYLYEIIAKESSRILKPSKFAIFYASDYWLDKTFPNIIKYLNYYYLYHKINTRGNASIFPRKIFAGAKSILVFSKGKAKAFKWTNNVLKINDICKEHRQDNWEQSVEDAKFFIDAFSQENDIVLDPNVGSGTACIAAKQLNRNYIGIDISEEYCNIARNRLKGGN